MARDSCSFIGPWDAVDIWVGTGRSASNCIVVKPGGRVKVKDMEIVAYDSFDRTIIVTTTDI